MRTETWILKRNNRIARIQEAVKYQEWNKAAFLIADHLNADKQHNQRVAAHKADLSAQLARYQKPTIKNRILWLEQQAESLGITLTEPLVTAVLKRLHGVIV